MRAVKRALPFFALIGATFAATGAFAAEAYTTATIWLRTGPDINFNRIELVRRNSSVDVYGCTDGYSWCDVDYEGERGWLPASRLQFVYNGRRGSVNNLAPFLGLMILEFSFQDYWSNHYQNRSWYNDRNIQRWQNWQQPRPQHRTQQAPPPPAPLQAPLASPPAAPSNGPLVTPQRQPRPLPAPGSPKPFLKQQEPAPQAPAPQAPGPKEVTPAPMQPQFKQNAPQQHQANPPSGEGGKGGPKKKCIPPEICNP